MTPNALRCTQALTVFVVSLFSVPSYAQAPQKRPTSKMAQPKPPVAATFDSLELSLGGARQRARIHILDLGDIPAGEAQTASLQVRNDSKRQIVLDLSGWGQYVKASWHDPDQPVASRKVIAAQGTVQLDIDLDCADPAQQTLQLVSLAENSVLVTSIIVAYVAHPATVVLPIVTGSFQSGLGTAKSHWYSVPSGPAPMGYVYFSDTFNTAGSDPAGNSRTCGNWVDCQRVQADSNNVIWQFRIQGYEHDWTHSDSSVMAQGILTVTYHLKPPPAPMLKTVEN